MATVVATRDQLDLRGAYPLRARRIALVGFGENTQPPESVWADPGIEKWTLNHGHGLDARWDRLFEFHSRETIDVETREHFRGVDQWDVLRREETRPIYMRDVDPDVPRSVRFPLQQFKRFFGAQCEKLLRRPYAEMAAAFMLGYAIMRIIDAAPAYNHSRDDGYEDPCPTCAKLRDAEILLYGFELFDKGEYAHQRACFEFYSGWAQGAGIRMHVPDASAIFANRGLYEYDTGESNHLLNLADKYLAERFEEIKKKFGEASARNADAIAEMQTLSGIMQEVEQNRKMVQHLLKGGSYG